MSSIDFWLCTDKGVDTFWDTCSIGNLTSANVPPGDILQGYHHLQSNAHSISDRKVFGNDLMIYSILCYDNTYIDGLDFTKE